MVWLTTDWDHRDPNHELEDVETGKCMDAIDKVGGNTRMLLESSDFRPIVNEDDDGHLHVVKLIRKRNPEFKQGRTTHFVYDREGNRVNLTEDEFDQLIGIQHNPDDVFNAEDLDLETLDSEHTAPRDDWDVVWDETEVLRAERQLKNTNFWDFLGEEQQEQELEMLREGTHPEYLGVREYSADFFQYPEHRRLVTPKAKLIADQVRNTDVTRWQMARLLTEPPKRDLRPEKARALRKQADKLPLGKEKARLLGQAQAMMKCHLRSVQAMKRRGKRYVEEQDISNSDKRALWALWRDQEIAKHGKVALTQWQYERALYAKLVRSGVDHSEARNRVYAAVKKLYNSDRIGRLVPYESAKLKEQKNPNWLQGVQPVSESETDDDNWQPCDWLPSQTEVQNDSEEID